MRTRGLSTFPLLYRRIMIDEITVHNIIMKIPYTILYIVYIDSPISIIFNQNTTTTAVHHISFPVVSLTKVVTLVLLH
ncbi:hypothetical protein HanIR_Chr07g0335781 [Helianthus annuus]|nr:hypothetical protein HanIR_Chr07g0335781 [Helianthus annuus]